MINKQQRQQLKQLIEQRLQAISLCQTEMRSSKEVTALALNAERLQSALARIDADNFGYCFKCEQGIDWQLLLDDPAKLICPRCIN